MSNQARKPHLLLKKALLNTLFAIPVLSLPVFFACNAAAICNSFGVFIRKAIGSKPVFAYSCMEKQAAHRRGQGATEYLVVLGAVLLVSMVVVQAVGSSTSTAASLKEEQSSSYWSSASPISISQFKLTADSLSLRLVNRLNEKVKITSIVAVDNSGVSRTLYSGSLVLGSGEENRLNNVDVRFNDGNPCKGKSSGTGFEIVQLVFNYDLTSGLNGYVQTGIKPLVGKCGQTNDWISFVPPTPASGASAGTSFTINATVIGVPALSEFQLNFNGTNYSVYDDSLVLSYSFEDNALLGENASTVVDLSNSGNNGTVYDNTLGLWHFDEGDGKTVVDESRFGNNGAIYGNTVGLWHFDERTGSTVYDESAQGNNGTANATWSSTGKSGSAITGFNTTNFIQLPNSTSLDILGSLTVEAWVNGTAWSDQNIIVSRGGGGVSNTQYLLSVQSGGVVFYSSNGTHLFSATGGAVNANTWNHLVGVLDNKTLKVYINGVKGTDSTFTGTQTHYQTKGPRIGIYADTGNYPFNGSIDEVAIYNRSLNGAEVLAHYQAGRAKFVEWNSTGKSGSALNFDGIQSFIALPNSTRPTGAHSISFWAYTNSLNASWYNAVFGGLGMGSQSQQGGIAFTYMSTCPCWTYYIYNSTNYAGLLLATTNLSIGQWSHMVLTWDGTSGATAMKAYNNGALVKTATGVSGALIWAFPFLVGSSSFPNSFYNGSIDEFEVINRTLSSAEVASLYASGRARRDSWNASGRWGSAMIFDGVNDYVRVGDSASLNVTGAITVSAWIKTAGTNSYSAIVDKFGDEGYELVISSGGQLRLDIGGTPYGDITGTTDLRTNDWYFVTGTYDGSFMRIYVDGVLQRTTPYSAGLSVATKNLEIGVDSGAANRFFNGSIDEPRVWNRALSAAEIRQQYYSNLQKYDTNKWLFTSNQTLLPSGTNSYYLYARSIDGAIDYSDNRTEVS